MSDGVGDARKGVRAVEQMEDCNGRGGMEGWWEQEDGGAGVGWMDGEGVDRRIDEKIFHLMFPKNCK